MTLLAAVEQTTPSLVGQVMRDCGIRVASPLPQHRVPVVVSASFVKGDFEDTTIHTAVKSYPIDPKDRLFAVTAKKLRVLLKATKFEGRIHIPVWVDLIRGDILAGRFTVLSDMYQPVDREQPMGYGGEDEHFKILANLRLVSVRR